MQYILHRLHCRMFLAVLDSVTEDTTCLSVLYSTKIGPFLSGVQQNLELFDK